MSATRRVARPLLSSIFIVGGLDAIRSPEAKVKAAEPVALPIAERIPGLPRDTETLVKVNGAVMVGAGALLAVGRFRRLAALALIGSILPTTYAGHRFWEEADEGSKAQQRIHFLKNLGLLGGLILAAVDTEGEPSLGWRAKRKAARAGKAVSVAPSRAAGLVGHGANASIVNLEDVLAVVSESKGRAAKGARKAARAVTKSGSRAADRAALKTNRAAAKASLAAARASLKEQKATLDKAQRTAVRAAHRGREAAEPVLSAGIHRAGEAWSTVAEHLPHG
jgi:uncharacterized membrane protein YphA (DoxX/SURF4 family)